MIRVPGPQFVLAHRVTRSTGRRRCSRSRVHSDTGRAARAHNRRRAERDVPWRRDRGLRGTTVGTRGRDGVT